MRIPAEIGQLLSQARERSNVRQTVLATRLNAQASRLSRIENGEIQPDADEVKDYLTALDAETGKNWGQEILDYLQQEWQSLKPPSAWHAESQDL